MTKLEGGSTRRKVLVVDDNRDAALSLSDILRMEGHDVQVAHDGDGALRGACAHLPDVILCDIGLPGLSGYDVARAVRSIPALAEAFLVAVTGYGSREDVARAFEAGFDLHLKKPVDPEAILALVAAAGS